jgi:ADP-heptose:LPS heptosyltransferase
MSAPRILISAARGIGDLVRMTSLVRAAARLGGQVDVLIAPDYPGAVSLLEGAPEIHRLYHCPSPWSRDRAQRLDGLGGTSYDAATFTVWSASLRGLVRARRVLMFDRQEWLREGDASCFERQARALGWTGPMPEPFACTSGRRFGLAPGTVALHPGCKPDWPWKKWHGFAELAERLPSVAVVGTPSDLDNRGTYFAQSFAWPAHVQDYVGRLPLADTAALIAESSALVSNDSGLMHVGVALGVPTFGIFGITSEQREALPSAAFFPVTKGLPCQPACRQGRWGRRDCEHHLQCLKTLTADDVLVHMRRANA